MFSLCHFFKHQRGRYHDYPEVDAVTEAKTATSHNRGRLFRGAVLTSLLPVPLACGCELDHSHTALLAADQGAADATRVLLITELEVSLNGRHRQSRGVLDSAACCTAAHPRSVVRPLCWDAAVCPGRPRPWLILHRPAEGSLDSGRMMLHRAQRRRWTCRRACQRQRCTSR
jgi:hypothetical protein